MIALFNKLDKVKPVFDITYKVILFLCKILLIADIAITSYVVIARFSPALSDPAWSEEVVLTLMSYMAVLSAALAIKRNAHIRMTAFDKYLPESVISFLNILADVMILVLAVVMIVVGWKYSVTIGSKGFFASMPFLSRFWMYFPVPLAGVVMIFFEIESIYNHIKGLFIKEDNE